MTYERCEHCKQKKWCTYSMLWGPLCESCEDAAFEVWKNAMIQNDRENAEAMARKEPNP